MDFVNSISQKLDSHWKPIVFNILNFNDIVADVDQRRELFQFCTALYDKRIKIQNQYAEKLSTLANTPIKFKKNEKQQKASIILCKNLLQSFRQESQAAQNIANKIEKEILSKMNKFSLVNDSNLKKLEASGLNHSKDLSYHIESFNKVYTKYIKKAQEITKTKTLCIVSKINPQMDFYQLNKLYVKVDDMEKQFKAQRQIYIFQLAKINQSIQNIGRKISAISQKLTTIQSERLLILKDVFMIMQQAKSMHGATLVHSTHVKLEQMDLVLLNNPQLQAHTEEQIQKNIQILKRTDINPSAYISSLFADIQNSKLEQLVNYGQQEYEKKRINNLFSSSETNTIQDPQISTEMIRIVEIFKLLFDQNSKLDDSLLGQFEKIIEKQPFRRKDFIFCLQRFRLASKFEVSAIKIQQIAIYLKMFLTKCMQEYDTHNPKMLMVLSCSYYIRKNEEDKIYMYQFIKDHNIWKDMNWWSTALIETIYQQIKIKNKKENNLLTEWHIKAVGCQTASSEPLTYSKIVSSQISAFVHNMGLFEVPPEQILKLTKRFQNLFNVPEEQIYHIIKLIEGLNESILVIDDSEQNKHEQRIYVKVIKKTIIQPCD